MIFTCFICNKDFKRYIGNCTIRCCSIKCASDYQSKYRSGENHPRWQGGSRVKNCQYCNEEFTNIILTIFKKQKFCSKECANRGEIRYKGKDHPNWTGNKTELQRLRCNPRYVKWSQKVLKRDNYTCQHCNKRGGDLHAHHMSSFLEFPQQRLDLENGVTLCVKHHRETHSLLQKKVANSVKLLERGQYRAKPEREGVEVSSEIMNINAIPVLSTG